MVVINFTPEMGEKLVGFLGRFLTSDLFGRQKREFFFFVSEMRFGEAEFLTGLMGRVWTNERKYKKKKCQ
jgi:hypothetical protein